MRTGYRRESGPLPHPPPPFERGRVKRLFYFRLIYHLPPGYWVLPVGIFKLIN